MSDPVAMHVLDAARWLATTPDLKRPRPLVPHLKWKFDLTVAEAIEALRETNLIRARAN